MPRRPQPVTSRSLLGREPRVASALVRGADGAAGTAGAANVTPDADRWWQLWRTGVTTVLMVSDNETGCSDVAAALSSEGYGVRVDSWSAPADGADLPFDLCLVDLGLTTRAATEVISEIRSRSTLPILAVAPIAAREVLVLDALAAGADQCAGQAAYPREMVARVRSLLRRHPPRPREVIDLRGTTTIGTISVEVATSTAVVDGEKIELARRECEVLHALLRQPGRVVTREALNRDAAPARNDRDLDGVVRRLRAKLEAVEGRRHITTVRGVGFRFDP